MGAMVDYRSWRIALSLAHVAIGLHHRLVAVSQALGPPVHPREGLATNTLAIGCRGTGEHEQIMLGHATDTRSQPHPPRTSCRHRPSARWPVLRSEGGAALRRRACDRRSARPSSVGPPCHPSGIAHPPAARARPRDGQPVRASGDHRTPRFRRNSAARSGSATASCACRSASRTPMT